MWARIARHHYSDDQPWNSDGTLLALQNLGGSPSIVYLDGKTYQPRFSRPKNYDVGTDRWHPSRQHPHERINITRKGTRLEWFDVVRGLQTRSWELPFPVARELAMNPSRDGRFVCLYDATRMFVVDMDPQPPHAPYPNRRIGPPTEHGAVGIADDGRAGGPWLDWAAISPSGKFVVVHYDGDQQRVFDVNPDTLALTPRPMPVAFPNMKNAGALGYIYDVGHADMTLNPFDNQEDVIVGQEHLGNRGKMIDGKLIGGVLLVRLRDGAITSLTDPRNEAYPFHVSARNFDRPGWVYVTYYPQPGRRFHDEIVAVKLDGGGAVERFAHTRSDAQGLYRAEPHAVPSRDGRRVIFASNWARDCGNSPASKNDIKAYVIETLWKETP